MNLAVIPLLVAALLMISGDQEVESVQLILSGHHELAADGTAVVVADGLVTVPAGDLVPGPIFVVGGELDVAGAVAGDLTQLAGSVTVHGGARVGGELQHVAGTLLVSDDAHVARRSILDLRDPARNGGSFIPSAVAVLLLAGVGFWLQRSRPAALANATSALSKHPVVSLTVGLMSMLTISAVLVFMAFTLVLIPVTLVGLITAVATVAYGVIVLGHMVGRWLPVGERGLATGLGVMLAVGGFWLLGSIPLVGDLLVAGIVAASLGSVLVTYYGMTRFRPDSDSLPSSEGLPE